VNWPSFPFEGDLRLKKLQDPVAVEPARKGEDANDCIACNAVDDAYIWVSDRWRVRAMDRPTGLPMVLILESRSHLDLGDLPNLLAAELGVMTVRLEKAIRSLDGVARVHVNRWGDGSAHLHMWFLARPTGRLQLRGTFLSLWDDILPPIPEAQWRENLAMVAAWLAEFGGRPLAEPPRIEWKTPSRFDQISTASVVTVEAPEIRPDASAEEAGSDQDDEPGRAAQLGEAEGSAAEGGPAQDGAAHDGAAEGGPARDGAAAGNGKRDSGGPDGTARDNGTQGNGTQGGKEQEAARADESDEASQQESKSAETRTGSTAPQPA
jgi:diadenosine tetraphosphate (Ap4A) HIT family hydrolase